MKEDFVPYAGRWVACLSGKIVGQGGTPRQAERAAQASRFKETPEVFFVPTTTPLTFSKILDQIRPVLSQHRPVYVVGGAVRDALLGRTTHDLDFALPGDGRQAARTVANSLGGAYFPLNHRHQTGRAILTLEDGNRYILDFASLRGVDLETDLQARDFTINAMAVDIQAPQTLLDPLNGAADLHAKRLRACSVTSLSEDAIRILRAIRLAAAFDLKIELSTRAQMRQAVHHLTEVSPERQRDELFRILEGPKPATALRALEMLGVLPYLLPELVPLKDLQQPTPHVFDVWQHTLHTMQKLEVVLNILGKPGYDPDSAGNLSLGLAVMQLGRYRGQICEHLQTTLVPDRALRPLIFLAALYHDVGKPQTFARDEQERIHFLGHEHLGTEIIASRARAFHLSNPEISRLKCILRNHMRPHHLAGLDRPPSRRAIYRFFRDTRAAGVDICLLNLADVLGTYGPSLPQETWSRHVEVIRDLLEAWWEKPQESVSPPPLVDGRVLIDQLDLEPGPQIGALLDRIREAQATGQVNSAEEALNLARTVLAEVKGGGIDT